MIDKTLETNIKKTKEFLEIWNKFHQIFENTISENHVDEEKVKEFTSVRDLVNSRYEDLMDSLGVKPLKRFIMSPAMCSLLSLERISIMSDEKSKSVTRDWKESCEFLNSLKARLEKKKKRIEGFNRFFFEFKKNIKRFK
ncbi:MAG: hypothetical protein ISS90_00765 [Candidatus Omnitrophica bacterium]|nr:hypothetical protein [Candidatus Omnitrophota bacterium]